MTIVGAPARLEALLIFVLDRGQPRKIILAPRPAGDSPGAS
jgi:hypothetical protein